MLGIEMDILCEDWIEFEMSVIKIQWVSSANDLLGKQKSRCFH